MLVIVIKIERDPVAHTIMEVKQTEQNGPKGIK